MIYVIIVILLLLIVVGISANRSQAANKSAALAEFEKIKRLNPDGPVSKLGENEFIRIKKKIKRKKDIRSLGAFLMGLIFPAIAMFFMVFVFYSIGLESVAKFFFLAAPVAMIVGVCFSLYKFHIWGSLESLIEAELRKEKQGA